MITSAVGSRTSDDIAPPMMPYKACVSLVMREMRSPVLARPKKTRGRSCKWANNFARKSATARAADQLVR